MSPHAAITSTPPSSNAPIAAMEDINTNAHSPQDTQEYPEDSTLDSSFMSQDTSFQSDAAFPSGNQHAEAERHPKGKRKRTTTQDKAILEAAYNANPKPDKAARLDIVKRVSLSEKEVQIWFQNRRQNDRRKSRPLSPQEIAALRYGGGVQILSSDPPIYEGKVNGDGTAPGGTRQDDSVPVAENTRLSPVTDAVAPRLSPQTVAAEVDEPTRNVVEGRAERSQTPSPSQQSESNLESSAHSQSFSSSIGYISNRRNMGTTFSTPSTLHRTGIDDSLQLDSFPPSASSAPDISHTNNSSPPAILPAPTSLFRLSLSLDGKAEVISSQPSPPRPSQPADTPTLPPVRPRTLHRSRSALPSLSNGSTGITLPPISTLTAHLPPRLGRGRSRDVHAWESCCDGDTRDELTAQAENESSGSAIAAISLLRSTSNTSAQTSLTGNGKRNVPPRGAPAQRGGMAKKARLGRTQSSVARLQSPHVLEPRGVNTSTPQSARDPEKEKSDRATPELEKMKPGKGSLITILSPGGDSDKENWSPDSEGNPMARAQLQEPPRRRPLPSLPPKPQNSAPTGNTRRGGKVLGEHRGHGGGRASPSWLLAAGRANTAPVGAGAEGKRRGKLAGVHIFEDGNEQDKNGDGEVRKRAGGDEEVERFMRGEVSPSKKPDMDCVAGLLSLSQGNWR